MSDTLLPYYNRELAAMRGLAGEFAGAHPKIAGRLRLSADSVDDPHVARLLEGLAFLAARVHHRLDDEFPELTDALLGVLYPHYLAPMPSCAIAQFQCKPDLDAPYRLPAGLSLDNRTGARRGMPFPDRLAADPVADRDRERPPVRPAADRPAQSARSRRGWRCCASACAAAAPPA